MTLYLFLAGQHDAGICAHILADGTVTESVEHEYHADGSVAVEFPGLTEQEIAAAVASYDPDAVSIKPDPDDELRVAIEAATDVASLKAALLGNKTKGRVRGRAV